MTLHAPLIRKRAPFVGGMRRSGSATVSSMTAAELARWFVARRDDAHVRNPYAHVSVFFACVRKRAESLSGMPLRISTADDQIVENGPLAQLAEQPNSEQSGRESWFAFSAFLDIFGKVYTLLTLSGGRVVAYRHVCPLEIQEHRPRPNFGSVTHYTYKPIGSSPADWTTLAPEEVHVTTEPDYGSGDMTKAISPAHAAALAIAQHYAADQANIHSLENGAGGGLALRTDQNLTQAQRDDLDRQIEDRKTGRRNRHKWMRLEGGLTVEKLFNTFAEMEFTEGKYYAREDICMAMGMSPLVIGAAGRNGLGSGKEAEAAHLAAWTDTFLPRADRLAESWMRMILAGYQTDRSLSLRDAHRRNMRPAECALPQRRRMSARSTAMGQRFYAWFDSSGVAILQRARLNLAAQAKLWLAAGVPLNAFLQATDAPFEDVPWGDTWYKPAGLIDVRDDSLGEIDLPSEPASPEAPIVDPEGQEKARRELAQRELTEKQLIAIWQKWWLSWRGLDRAFKGKIGKHFLRLRKGVLDRLAKALGDKSLKGVAPDAVRDVIGQILFDLTEANGALRAAVGPIIRQAFELGGAQVMVEHAEAQGAAAEVFNIAAPEVEQAMRRRLLSLSGINRTVSRRVAAQIADGLHAQETVAQITERVRHEFNLASGRSATIARTETGRAVEEARQLARLQANVPLKSWLWSHKADGRDQHAATEQVYLANPIPSDQDFEIAGTGIRCPFPRATGIAEQDINCACTTLSRYPDDSIKALISRYLEHDFLTYEKMMRKVGR